MAMEWASAAPVRLVLISATCAPTLNNPSQAAMKSTRMIADNVQQWKRAADGLRKS